MLFFQSKLKIKSLLLQIETKKKELRTYFVVKNYVLLDKDHSEVLGNKFLQLELMNGRWLHWEIKKK